MPTLTFEAPTPPPPTETLPPPTDVPLPTATDAPPATATPTETLIAATATEATAATETLVGLPTETATSTPAATETLAATPFPPEPPLTLLYSDNFDSGALYVWNVGAGWSLVPSEDGLALQTNDTLEPVTFAHATLLDAAAEARFRLHGGGVQFHLRQSSVGAYTVLVTADGQVTLYRAGIPLVGAAIPPVTPDQWITVRLSAIGEMIRVTVNGVEVIATVDPVPLPPGTVAFAGVGSLLLMDDVSLWISATAQPTLLGPQASAAILSNVPSQLWLTEPITSTINVPTGPYAHWYMAQNPYTVPAGQRWVGLIAALNERTHTGDVDIRHTGGLFHGVN